MYRPAEQFNVPMKILNPAWETVNGVARKVYPRPEDVLDENIVFCSFKTFGGTLTDNNGTVGIENTATITTWYRPDIRADSRLVLLSNGEAYDLIGDPENIEQRNQFLILKVKRIGGKN